MERVLALTLFVLATMGVVTVKLLSRAGVFDTKSEWTQYLAAHASLWLLLVPLVYAAICLVATGRESSAAVLTVTRAIGFALLAGFGFLLVWLIFS